MARREFDVVDVVEILQHWHAGRPKAAIGASLGVDPKTIRKYVAPAVAAGIVAGGPPLSREVWAGLVAEWFPLLVDAKARSLTFVAVDTHRETIVELLDAGVTVSTIHQRLRDEDGLAVSVASVRRYVHLEFPDRETASHVTVPRPEVDPGEEAQIDFGYLGSWFDPLEARMRRIWAFVMVLVASRHMFVRPMLSMNQMAWVAAHVAAFEFFDGAPRRLVPDNLKTGVDRHDLYDPKLNRAYADLAAHYGCLIDPARAGKPKDKPRVERPMNYIRDSFWAGRCWESEAAMQTAALVWCREVAGRRSHSALCGAAPYVVFQATEAESLLALPPDRFELARWSTPKVGPDCHIKVAAALYSVPWRLIGRRVDTRASEQIIEVFVNGALVKTHARVPKGKRATDWADFPPEKVAFFMRTPAWCRRRAGELGPNVTEIIAELLTVNALYRLRSAQGIIGLAERHGPQRLDAACRRALDVGDPTYRTVKGILAAGTEHDHVDQLDVASMTPAHLHGPASLFDGLEGAAS
jgi:transposase